jgi:hypothetical protein
MPQDYVYKGVWRKHDNPAKGLTWTVTNFEALIIFAALATLFIHTVSHLGYHPIPLWQITADPSRGPSGRGLAVGCPTRLLDVCQEYSVVPLPKDFKSYTPTRTTSELQDVAMDRLVGYSERAGVHCWRRSDIMASCRRLVRRTRSAITTNRQMYGCMAQRNHRHVQYRAGERKLGRMLRRQRSQLILRS